MQGTVWRGIPDPDIYHLHNVKQIHVEIWSRVVRYNFGSSVNRPVFAQTALLTLEYSDSLKWFKTQTQQHLKNFSAQPKNKT